MNIEPAVIGGSLHLYSAVLLYGNSYHHDHTPRFASVHPVSVDDESGAPEIEAGVPLTHETLEKLVAGLGVANEVRAWRFVEPEVIASGPAILAWWTPACVRHVFYKEETQIPCGPAAQPAMLWVRSRKNGLYVYALASDERPTADTPVFNAPHYNVWCTGRVCEGSALKSDFEDRAGCMESYWTAAFAHRNDSGRWKQTVYRPGLRKLLQKLAKEKGATPFPVKYLEPSKLTVSKVISQVDGSHD